MIDLCIVSYNTKYKLRRLLDCLHSDISDNVWRLYIADNGSADGTDVWWAEYAPEYKYEDFLFNDNIGYAAAANKLASMGEGDIIGILNADVWLTTNNVKQIQTAFDEDPNIAILGP